jgi:hypothetical protein
MAKLLSVGIQRHFWNRSLSTLFASLFIGGIFLAVMSPDERYVAAPGFACIILILWLWMILWHRDRRIPFFDVGIFCALATLVYTIYPLVNYWIEGFQFGLLSDNRLRFYNPEPREIGLFHLRHFIYLFSFVTIYSVFRGRSEIETGKVVTPNQSGRIAIAFFFLIFSGYFWVLQFLTGVNYNTSYELEAFYANVSALADLPLLLLQISGKLWGVLFIFKLALLGIVVSRCRERRWLVVLLAWVVIEILQPFFIKGARTGMIMFLMATALFYHRLINPLAMRILIPSGILIFVIFIFLGFYRSYLDLGFSQTDLAQAEANIFSGSNEFQSLLATAYDVFQRKEAGTYLPWYLYINDFSGLLPPQQLMPFEKVSASEWYLREIDMSGMGFGFMWGVISQAIVGLDWIELAIRGGILGFILARLHQWYVNHQSGFLANLFYIYLCLRIYYTFRDTTFSILANLLWEFFPFFVLWRLGMEMVSFSGRTLPTACNIHPIGKSK